MVHWVENHPLLTVLLVIVVGTAIGAVIAYFKDDGYD